MQEAAAGRAGTPGPRSSCPRAGYGRRRVQTSCPAPPWVPAPGGRGGCPGGLGSIWGGGQGSGRASRSHSAALGLCGQGEGWACLLEMLDLLRAEPWQEWPLLLHWAFHLVLGPSTQSLNTATSSLPSGPQPRILRNPAILRPLCQAGRLLRKPPPGLCRHCHVHAKLSHTTRL